MNESLQNVNDDSRAFSSHQDLEQFSDHISQPTQFNDNFLESNSPAQFNDPMVEKLKKEKFIPQNQLIDSGFNHESEEQFHTINSIYNQYNQSPNFHSDEFINPVLNYSRKKSSRHKKKPMWCGLYDFFMCVNSKSKKPRSESYIEDSTTHQGIHSVEYQFSSQERDRNFQKLQSSSCNNEVDFGNDLIDTFKSKTPIPIPIQISARDKLCENH